MESIRDDEHMVEARSNGGKHCGRPKIGVRLEFKRNNTRKLAPPTFANGPIEGVAKTVFCPLVEECFLTST